ncbi:hypothetical protein P171DRAFT_139755 [Karstenula rhodostoma CBS 690.94]|uniref:Uncharacterized protein n=1 Tax=Karstenula rhodostoma CBS 690.94 TaxID=1392251 RepID=A0A9P4PWY9_9PLEO|nr:hypothetical protein P171DRAFT_139755 [Karstenula rhodostoma CBS 690.94]
MQQLRPCIASRLPAADWLTRPGQHSRPLLVLTPRTTADVTATTVRPQIVPPKNIPETPRKRCKSSPTLTHEQAELRNTVHLPFWPVQRGKSTQDSQRGTVVMWHSRHVAQSSSKLSSAMELLVTGARRRRRGSGICHYSSSRSERPNLGTALGPIYPGNSFEPIPNVLDLPRIKNHASPVYLWPHRSPCRRVPKPNQRLFPPGKT